MTISDLPAINASLNGLCTLLLIIGFVLIKQGKKEAHQKVMVAALTTSVVFLCCYLYYHFNTEVVTRFRDPAWFRPIYLTILLTHTILAVVIVPMVLMTFARAFKGDFERHKKIARWTWPLWMYVSTTGVLIYFLLYQIFPQVKA